MRTLALFKELSVPLSVATDRWGFFGGNGSGKTYCASKLVEEFIDAGVQTGVIDSVGIHYNLRRGVRGGPTGKALVVFGGLFGDVAITKDQGAYVADAVIDLGCSYVIDVSQLKRKYRSTFLAAYADRLWERVKARPKKVLFQLVEEAHLVVPEKPPKGDDSMECADAFTEITTVGRNFGIGIGFITPRPQDVRKSVLNVVTVLVAFQAGSHQARKAMEEWMVQAEVDGQQQEQLRTALAFLPVGEGILWSPRSLRHFGHVHALPKETFDGGATPAVGEHLGEIKLAPVDLDAVKDRLKVAIAEAEKSDPAALQRRTAELERDVVRLRAELAKAQAAKPAPASAAKVVEKKVITDAQLARVEKMLQHQADADEKQEQRRGKVTAELRKLVELARDAVKGPGHDPARPARFVQAVHVVGPKPVALQQRTAAPATRAPAATTTGDLGGGGELKILTAVAQHQGGCTREQLTILIGLKRSSRDTYLQKLKQKGYVTQDGERVVITDAGAAALPPDYEPLPTGSALLEFWRQKLGNDGERVLLDAIVARYPAAVARDEIDAVSVQTGEPFKRSSRDTYLQKLRARQLITEPARGQVRASDQLFDAGAEVANG